MEFSIIIPAYNVEGYIVRSLDSILAQGLPASEYEIIVVNDGSTDKTEDIVMEYTYRFRSVQLITIPNSGPSVARNTGIQHAAGRYLMFVDPDDYLVSGSLLPLLAYVKERDEDVIGLRYCKVDEDGKTSSYHHQRFPVNKVYSGREFIEKNNIIGVVWGYLFRSEFIKKNKITMIPGIFHQDEEFVSRAIFMARRVIMSEYFTYYYYYKRKNSTVNRMDMPHRERLIKDTLTVICSLWQITLKSEDSARHLARKLRFLSLDLIRLLIREGHSEQFIRDTLFELRQRGTYPLPYDNYGLKYFTFRHLVSTEEKVAKLSSLPRNSFIKRYI